MSGLVVATVAPATKLEPASVTEKFEPATPLDGLMEASEGGAREIVKGTAEEVLKNQPHDQFGTLIPFTADETTTKPDVLAMIGNVLRNGFVRAYLPKLEQGAVKDQGINFSTPAPIEANSTGEKS